jgi:glycosyltransferase involved in cell wall biosynthesis
MPRVLRILNRLIIGGPATNATLLTKYMEPAFDTVLVIGEKDDHEQDATFLTDNLGIKPVVVSKMKRSINPVNDGKAYLEVKALIEKYKPDIVHTHAAKAGIIGRMAAEACNVPVIIHTFHGHVFHSYFSKWQTESFIMMERYLARRSTGIVAISKTQKDELVNTYKICADDKMNIIPLGLDLDKFKVQPEEKRIEFRNKYKAHDDDILIGIVGRIVPVKNHALFVEAAARVIAQTNKKVKFIVIGDGDMRQQMENEFRKANIDYSYFPYEQRLATATCLSWQMNMDEVFSALDIVALTSHNEGTPLSLIEAQAAGRALVSTNVGGVTDVVLQNKSGYVVEPGNAEDFANGLLKLIEDIDLRKDFGLKGVEFAHNNFSYQRLVSDMSGYYFSLLEHNKKK